MVKILVVEDNPGVQGFIKMSLLMKGHTVEVANNGEEALEMYKAAAEKPNFLITDWSTGGGLDGVGLIRALIALNPDLPIIMQTANVGVDLPDDIQKIPHFKRLNKPFKPMELTGLVDTMLQDSLAEEVIPAQSIENAGTGPQGIKAASRQSPETALPQQSPPLRQILPSTGPGQDTKNSGAPDTSPGDQSGGTTRARY